MIPSSPPPLPNQRLTTRQRWGRLALALVPAGALAAVTLLPWGGWLTGRFRAWTGLPCPFCGGTRALRALIRGDLEAVLYYSPLTLAVAVAAGLWAAWCLTEAATGRPGPRFWTGRERRLGAVALVALAIYWIIHATLAWTTPKTELLDSQGWVWRLWGQ